MPAHEFNLQPSRQWMIIFALMILVSLIIPLCVSMPIGMKLICLVGIGFYGVQIYKQYVAANECVIIRSSQGNAVSQRDTDWILKTKTDLFKAELLGDSVVTAFILILRFRVPQKVITQIIFRDSLPIGDYRKLFLAIKWQH